jgi:polysaccharide biosynthesis protein PslH
VSRVLFLLPSVPAPLDAGAKIRNHGLLKLVGAEHEVDALAFGSRQAQTDLAKLVGRAMVVPPPRPRSPPQRAADMAASDLPDMALRLWSPVFEQALRCALENSAYDAIQAEGVEMARYLDVVAPSRRVYDAHNAEFLLQRRATETATTLAARLYSRLQWRRLERFERQILELGRMTLAVSNHDANQLLALAGPHTDVRVVPNGIDVASYACLAPPDDAAPNVLFLGKLDFRPNAEGLRWFVDNVLKVVNEARLFAVGAAPPRWLIEAGQHDDRIAVTGYVADERRYLRRCAALVLPVRAGGGSRIKALVAWASGVPIVSTRFGMEGLDAEPETHYVVAESAADWVASVRRVLGDAELRQRLALNGRGLVERRYDWSAIRADVHAAYAWLAA